MKNKKIKILSFLFVVLMVPSIVKAGLVCDNSTAYIVEKGDFTFLDVNDVAAGGMYTYPMRLYNTTSNGVSGIKTYCIEPVLKAPWGANYCDRRIDPSDSSNGPSVQAYDVAATKAYEILLNDGRNTTSVDDRIVGEIIFRWIGSNYGQRSFTPAFTQDNTSGVWLYANKANNMFNAPFTTKWWDLNNPLYEYAKEVFYKAIAEGNKIINGSKYPDLVNDGSIWGDKYNFSTKTETKDGLDYVTVEIEATNSVQNIYWSQFKGGCSNQTTKCTVMSATGSGNKGTVVIQVNKAGDYNGQNYGIYIDSYIYDVKSASSNMIIVRIPGATNRQRMLLVIDESLAITNPNATPRGGSRHDIYTDRCELGADNKYYYFSYKNGNETSKTEVTTEDDMIRYSCPVNCVLRSDSVRTDAQYSWTLAEHRGNIPAGYGSGNFYNKAGFEKFCQTPVVKNSCKIDNGTYFGKDGSKVTRDKYYSECCDTIEPTSDDYKKFCSCGTPDIDFKGACTEFNSSTKLENHVNDVSDNANLKYCLFNINNKDKAGNSYQMTDQDTVSNNPYCKVSCVEEYKFNLPNAKYSTSGSYFTLSTEIIGKRTCYVNGRDTSEGIDYTKFKKDLEFARKEIITAYNNYAGWLVAASITATEKTVSDSTSGNDCGPGSSPDCESCSGDSGSTTNYSKTWAWSSYTPEGVAFASSDSYSSGSVSCGSCTCTVTAGVDPDETHIANRDAALTNLNNKISALKSVIQTYNNCYGVVGNPDSELNSVGWENNFKFDPSIQFQYEEPYQNMPGFNDKFVKVETIEKSEKNNYCTNDVGDTYECSGVTVLHTKSEKYFSCFSSGCEETSSIIGDAKFITKQKTEGGIYKPNNNFSVYTPSGTIGLDKDGTYKLYSALCAGAKNCLPVALNKETGVFNYKFTYSQIGQFNGDNNTGRLVGGANSLFNAVENAQNAGYVCQYVNNCPDCEYVCAGDDCDISDDDCVGDECIRDCETCIFDGKDNTYTYRTVSINNLFPSDRPFGPNWDNVKGKYTKKVIEESGEEVYREPQYSYTITAQQMNKIRDYNKAVGNYLNTKMPNGDEALDCFKQKSDNGMEFSNVSCNSVFLNTPGTEYFKVNKRNDRWTLWPDSGYYNNTNKYTIVDGMGPSWK